jgi:signal peptidase II
LKSVVPLSRYLVFFPLAIGVCAIDLATKRWMFNYLGMPGPDGKTLWLWEGVFGFRTNLNEGALFGMFQGFSPLFASLSIAAAIAILMWLFAIGAAKDWILTIALGFVTAGILGNLYDRLGLPGLVWNDIYHRPGQHVYAVRDFIHMMIGPWAWPTYNIADSSLVCGAALLFLHAFFSKPEKEMSNREQSDSDQCSVS